MMRKRRIPYTASVNHRDDRSGSFDHLEMSRIHMNARRAGERLSA
jgi:hypothetical protein